MLDALFGTRKTASPSPDDKQKGKLPLPLASDTPAVATLREQADNLRRTTASASMEKVLADLRNLDDRIIELLQIWDFMAKAFPEGSPRYTAFMELNRQIRERYKACLDALEKNPSQEKRVRIIQATEADISLLVQPHISMRLSGQKPLHRLVQQKASSKEEQAQLDKGIARLIQEGANPRDRTRMYPRRLIRSFLDALSQFPSPKKMYRAFFENPKKDVFEMSQSSDSLNKTSTKQNILLTEVKHNPKLEDSLPTVLLAGVRNMLDLFSTPVKPWAEKLNPSHAMSQLIGLHEELLGQSHLQSVHQYLLLRDREITGDFFRIIFEFKRSTDLNRFKKVNAALKQFFGQLGIPNIAEVFFNADKMLEQESLEKSLEIQILYYLIAYIYKAHNVNREGDIVEKYQEDFDSQVEKCLKVLEAVDFSPAYAMHTKLNTVDFQKVQQISIEGALLGNMQCQYTLCGHYFAHLTGTLSKSTPPPFDFPKGINQEIIIEWAKAVRDEGYTDGLANMQNFMTNFFGAAGAYYQEGEPMPEEVASVTPKQKERIIEIAAVVKAISGDTTVNQFVDDILNLQGDKEAIKAQYKKMRQQASDYLVSDYTQQFRRTEKSIEKVMASSLMNRIFERHAVFEMLLCIEHEMNIERENLQAKGSETAELYLYPLRRIQEFKRILVTETDKLRYLQTNDPNVVMLEAEKLLRELYQNVKAKEEVSAAHKTSLRSLKHEASRCVLHILPKGIVPGEVHRTKAIAVSYNLYQAAKKISEGKAGVDARAFPLDPQTPRTPKSPREQVTLRSPRSPRVPQ